jgi:hypothetical protein
MEALLNEIASAGDEAACERLWVRINRLFERAAGDENRQWTILRCAAALHRRERELGLRG